MPGRDPDDGGVRLKAEDDDDNNDDKSKPSSDEKNNDNEGPLKHQHEDYGVRDKDDERKKATKGMDYGSRQMPSDARTTGGDGQAMTASRGADLTTQDQDMEWDYSERVEVQEFERVLAFKQELDTDNIQAKMEHGVLHVEVPKVKRHESDSHAAKIVKIA